MLDDAITTTAGTTPRTYRERQADWWANEARECAALEMHDLAAKCLLTAEDWRRDGDIDWSREP